MRRSPSRLAGLRVSRHRSGILVSVLAAIALAAAPVAAARTTPFSFAYDETTIESPCGFDVVRHDVGKAMGRARPNGDVDLTNAGVDTLTNLTTGLSVTEDYQILFKVFNFVDNGATQTLDVTTVGSYTMRGPDGGVLLRSHGPSTSRLTFNAGFPASPVILSQHGAHPDQAAHCAALTAAIFAPLP